MHNKTYFVCQQCGHKSPSFLGRCPECGSWSSFSETIEATEKVSWGKGNRSKANSRAEVSNLQKVSSSSFLRISTGIREADQVLGMSGTLGGFVPGSLVLLSGDPGIGKSTLTLQLISKIGGLYVSGEESAEQVRMRAERLKVDLGKILILPETNIESIIASAESRVKEIKLLVIDSIQTLWSEELTGTAGSVGQVRECTLKLMEFAKKKHIPVLLIGHVTKEGTIAGPKVLEHIVDTVLYLEGERYQSIRLLRTTKNRFGPVDEVGVFSMEENGMKEVANPSEIFIGDVSKSMSNEAGRAIVVTLEGSRPLLVEIQALCVSTQLAIPRRVGNGINSNRLQMLVAIIQKHLRLPLERFDIYVNAVSGLRVFEPAADLGICLAVISSFKNIPIKPKTAVVGEVGLLGEIRKVIGQERRLKEAKKLGFSSCITYPEYPDLRICGKLF